MRCSFTIFMGSGFVHHYVGTCVSFVKIRVYTLVSNWYNWYLKKSRGEETVYRDNTTRHRRTQVLFLKKVTDNVQRWVCIKETYEYCTS